MLGFFKYLTGIRIISRTEREANITAVFKSLEEVKAKLEELGLGLRKDD